MRSSVSASRMRSPTVGPYIDAYAERLMVRGMNGPLSLERTHDGTAESHDAPKAREGDQLHVARLARLESQSRARCDIEPSPERLLPIERQRRIHLEEMEMTANLDRSVSRIGYARHDREGVGVEHVLAIIGE